MRIGILGGTFNPVHKGHLRLAQEAGRRLKLDKVIFVPANIPPHKTKTDIISARQRYKMVAAAVRGFARFAVSDYEIKKGGTSYSVKTLEAFRKKFGKKTKLFFIAGADSLPQLKLWKNPGKIIKLADFVIFSRPGYRIRKIRGVKVLSMPALAISSTDIRQRVKNSKSVKRFLPPAVYSYINKKGFYR